MLTSLVGYLAKVPPADGRAMLIALMHTVLSLVSDDYWREFKDVQPCGTPGCDCHVGAKLVVDAFEVEVERMRRRRKRPGEESLVE